MIQQTESNLVSGFSQDSAGDYIIHLDCGHRQHVRHSPPWQERSFVIDGASRRARIGTTWDCPWCSGLRTGEAPVGPLELKNLEVEDDWIDYNGHMNVAWYVLAFDRGVDVLLDEIGVGKIYLEQRHASMFTLEINVHYLAEAHRQDPLRLCGQLLAADNKRIHFFLYMYHAADGHLLATLEQVALHVDMQQRRSAPFPDDIKSRLDDLIQHHRRLDRPEQLSGCMGLKSR
ncbi:MAG: hypothetical protein DHS20C01_34570 [marine bacterium B5-7]|nr:MAG: hypothetical protein DHS20C01_34570 [marine bacterium B5-7]